jgi:hypothetical protein
MYFRRYVRPMYEQDGVPQGGVTVTEGTPTPEPVAPVEPPAPTDPAPTDPPAPVEPPPTTEPDSAAGLRAAATVERKKRQEAQEQARQAREEAAYLRGQLAAATPATPAEPAAPTGPPQAPRSDDFESWDDFQAADRQYIVKLAEHNVMQNLHTIEQQRTAQRTQQEVDVKWENQTKAAVTKYPDFHEVVSNPQLPISDTVALALKSSEQGADVAYFLGTNLTEAARINALPPIQAAMALGQIAATLANKPAAAPLRTVSQAPEPIAPVNLTVAPTPFDPETASMADYRAWRQTQMKPNRR